MAAEVLTSYVETNTNQTISQHKNLRLALDKAEPLNVEAAAAAPLREVWECGYQEERYPYPCSAPENWRRCAEPE